MNSSNNYKNWGIRNTNISEETSNAHTNGEIPDDKIRMNNGSLYYSPPPGEKTNNRVAFTIGDSSDCDSVTTASDSAVTDSSRPSSSVFSTDEELQNDDKHFERISNPWRKYHFQNGTNENLKDGRESDHTFENIVDSNDGAKSNLQYTRPEVLGDTSNQRLSPSMSTGLMIPNFANDNLSLARLEDVSSEDGENEGRIDWGKWRILLGCAIVQLFSALMVSLQAPFYPAEAEKKGCTATEYGFVFGVFELTVFIVAPFYGSRIHKWDPKLVLNIGICTASLSSIIFGILDQIPNGKYFIAASAVVRSIEALGESAVITATFVIVASAFPESVAANFALIESCYSLGLLLGPFIILYQIGGYSLPFLVVGGFLLAALILNFVILPSSRTISGYQRREPIVISSYKSFRLLGMAGVTVSALCIILGAMSISYLQATLEPHLRQFGISQLTTGAFLIINGAVYTITAPFWGLLCDKVLQLKLLSFCGSAVLMSGFALVGPIPIFQFEQKLWIISLGLTLQGLGLGAMLVSSFVSILNLVIRKGFPDNPSTYGLVTSLWTSMFSIGSFIGPSLSGTLYSTVGFANGSLSIIVFSMITMCVLLGFICITDFEMEGFTDSESEPLLNNSTAAVSVSIYSNEVQPYSTSRRGSNCKWTISKPRSSFGSLDRL